MKPIRATIEITSHSEFKYEIDKTTGKLFIDRVVNIPYPANYGFINNTLWDDGDALDVFVVDAPLDSLTEANVIPFAVIDLEDNGVSDTKLVAKVAGSVDWRNRNRDINEILHFLNNYKEGIVIKSVSIREKDIENTLLKGSNSNRLLND